MFLVDSTALGRAGFSRMVRDGVVRPATRRFGLPLDIEVTAGVRACCVAPSVPAHTVLSGAAGLWVWHGGKWPGELTVVGERGLHRGVADHESSPLRDRVTFHSGLAWRDGGVRVGPVAVANTARCCVDALRWDGHRNAIPVVVEAVMTGNVSLTDLQVEVGRDDPRGSGYSRLREVWRVLYPVLSTVDLARKQESRPRPRMRTEPTS